MKNFIKIENIKILNNPSVWVLEHEMFSGNFYGFYE